MPIDHWKKRLRFNQNTAKKQLTQIQPSIKPDQNTIQKNQPIRREKSTPTRRLKRIIVTPAGRRRYLEILHNELKKQRNDFDSWEIWINTTNNDDINFIRSLACGWIMPIEPEIPIVGNSSIYHFFKRTKKDVLYLRLDDDIVYIGENAVRTMFDRRQGDKKHFLLYGNIVNNSITSHLYQRYGYIVYSQNIGYNCMDAVGWNDPKFAEFLHRQFLSGINFQIPDWTLRNYERCSINAISYRGDMFNSNVGIDEEQWLSVDHPKSIGINNLIIGNAIFVHFAFYTQRDFLDKTNLLTLYKSLSNQHSLPH